VIKCASIITVDKPELIKGKRALVVEDGPTLTHGGMTYGRLVCRKHGGAVEIVDCKPYAVGTIAATYKKYRTRADPAGNGLLGPADRRPRGDHQRDPCDVVVEARPSTSPAS